MLRCFYFIPFFIFLYSCSVTQDPPVHVHPENFKAGQMLQDIRPLSSSRNTDLREMAFTLPIIESRNNLDWYYEESESAVSSPRWNLPADGAQDPVVLVRLPRLEDGSQQIQMQYSPIPVEDTPTYYSNLKRINGGWEVLKTWIK